MRPSLAKNSMFNVAYQLVLVLVPLISSMYVSRVVLPDALGEVSVANNLVSYFVALAPLGIPAYGVREIAKAGDDKRARSAVFSELLLINFLSTVVFLAAYAVCVAIMYGTAIPELYLIFGSLIVANALNVEWLFQGIERYDFISIRGTVVRAACLLLTVIFVKSPSDVCVYAAITCLGTFANYIVNVLCLRRSVDFTFRGLSFARHFRPVAVLAGTNVLFSLYTKIDITMMGFLCTSSIVAYYSYAYNAEEIAKTLCVAITNVYLPRLSYEFKNDAREFSRLVQQSMDLNVFIALPMCLGVFILAPKVVLVLFGDAFAPASLTLRLFAFLIFAKSVGNVIYQTTIATGGGEVPAHRIYLRSGCQYCSERHSYPFVCSKRRCGCNGGHGGDARLCSVDVHEAIPAVQVYSPFRVFDTDRARCYVLRCIRLRYVHRSETALHHRLGFGWRRHLCCRCRSVEERGGFDVLAQTQHEVTPFKIRPAFGFS